MFAKTNHKSYISIDKIEMYVSQRQLLQYYFNLSIGLHKSPFRDESKPSFGIYEQSNTIKYKDFATGEFGGIYDMLEKKFCTDLNNVLRKISKDFRLNNYLYETKTLTKAKKQEDKKRSQTETDIKIRVRDWNKDDVEYWESYGITMSIAKKYGVIPIDYYWINNISVKADKLAYAYIKWDGEVPKYKIYQPLSKTRKWRNNYKKDTISLIDQADTDSEKVVICSSVKDALCLICNFGITCIAPQGEGFDIDMSILIDKFPKAKFYILFDNDEAGLELSKKLSEKLGIENIVLPKFEGGKDISDMYLYLKKDEFVRVMSTILKI